MLPNYDEQSDPKQLVATFDAMVQSFKGDTAVLAKSLVMTIQGIAQTWYMSLKPRSISSWQQLKEALYANFQGFHMQPVTSQALFACKQEPGESLQSYVRRFLNMKAQIARIMRKVVRALPQGQRPSSAPTGNTTGEGGSTAQPAKAAKTRG